MADKEIEPMQAYLLRAEECEEVMRGIARPKEWMEAVRELEYIVKFIRQSPGGNDASLHLRECPVLDGSRRCTLGCEKVTEALSKLRAARSGK